MYVYMEEQTMKKVSLLICLVLLTLTMTGTISAETENIQDALLMNSNESIQQEEDNRIVFMYNEVAAETEISEVINEDDNNDTDDIIENIPSSGNHEESINVKKDSNLSDNEIISDEIGSSQGNNLNAIESSIIEAEGLEKLTVSQENKNKKYDPVYLSKGTVIYSDVKLMDKDIVLGDEAIVCAQLNNDDSIEITYALYVGDSIEIDNGYVGFTDVVFLSLEQVKEWQNATSNNSIVFNEWNLTPVTIEYQDQELSEKDITDKVDDTALSLTFDFGYEDGNAYDDEKLESDADVDFSIVETEKNEGLEDETSNLFSTDVQDSEIDADSSSYLQETKLAVLREGSTIYSDPELNLEIGNIIESSVVIILEETEEFTAIRYAIYDENKELTLAEDYVEVSSVDCLGNEEVQNWQDSEHENSIVVNGWTLEGLSILNSLSSRGIESGLISRAAESDFVVDTNGIIIEYKGTQTAITIPEKVGSIAVTGLSETAFSRNTSINYVTIHDKITYIARGVFKDCTGLLSVSMPNEITYISAEAFEGCTSLQSVSWPAKLTTIEHDAFKNCTSFAGLALPAGIKIIEDNAFSGCVGLTYVDLPSDLEIIGSGSFNGCSALKEIIIPDTVKEMGNSVFEGCSSVTTLHLSSLLTEIKNFSFKGCTNLTDLVVPNKVASIGREAFNGCTSLTTIEIPENVTNVGVDAFSNIANSPYFMIYSTNATYSDNALGKRGIVLGYSDSTAEEYCSSRQDLTFRSIQIVAFVKNAYSNILGRDVDQTGLITNVKELIQGASATSIVNGLINSSEFKKRKLSDVNTLPLLYKTMLGRALDAKGKADYEELLVERGVSIYYIINEIAKSYEFDLFCIDHDIIPGSIALTQNRDQNAKISGFVARCYTKLLKRTFDVEGLNNWTGSILRGEKTGCDIIIGFIRSKEFQSFGLSNNEAVERLYLTMLDRASDSEGKAYWLSHMSNGTSIEYVVDGFSNSTEFKNLCNAAGMQRGKVNFTEARDKNYKITCFVYRCYMEGLGRTYDIPGMNNWCQAMISKTNTPGEVARGFALSDEAASLYKTDSSFIYMMYRLCFDRTGDTDGVKNWKNYMAAGATREMVVTQFVSSKEFANLVRSFGL